MNAGVLPAGRQSTVQVIEAVPGNDVLAVSLEPAGGSTQPGNVLAQVPLA